MATLEPTADGSNLWGSAQLCYTLWRVQRDSESTTLDGGTMITKDNAPGMPLPPLTAYKTTASRGPESVPALFYRQMTGEAWDGKARSYSLATKKFRRLLPAYQHGEREREQRRKQRSTSSTSRTCSAWRGAPFAYSTCIVCRKVQRR